MPTFLIAANHSDCLFFRVVKGKNTEEAEAYYQAYTRGADPAQHTVGFTATRLCAFADTLDGLRTDNEFLSCGPYGKYPILDAKKPLSDCPKCGGPVPQGSKCCGVRV